MELIRNQALADRNPDALGSVDLTQTRLAWPITLSGMLFVLVLCVFVFVAEHTRKQQVSGQLVPQQGLVSVLAPESGVLIHLQVSEGETVEAGQTLAEISLDRQVSELQSQGLSEIVSNALKRQRRQYQTDLKVLQRGADMHSKSLQQQLELLAERLRINDSQQELKRRQLEGVASLWAKLQGMKSGALTAFQLQQHEAAVLAAEAELNDVILNRLQIQRELAEVEDQQHTLPLDNAQARSTIEQALAELDQADARNMISGSQILRAPRDGIVATVYAASGQSVTAGRPLISLLPTGAQLVAELWVPSEAIGTLAEGDQVKMRYRAYPYRRFGHQSGQIMSVSGSALPAEEVLTASGLTYHNAMYRVRVSLDRQTVASLGNELPLRSGMYVDADLLLERRPLFQFAAVQSKPAKTDSPPATAKSGGSS